MSEMSPKRARSRGPSWLAMGVGIALIALSLSAGLLGVDTDLKWGPFRWAVFGMGGVVLVIPLLSKAVDALDRRLMSRPGPLAARAGHVHQLITRLPPIDRTPDEDRGALDAGGRLSTPQDGIVEPQTRGRIRLALGWTLDRVRARKRIFSLTITLLVVEALYLSFATAWNWTTWQSTTHYYALLATAFADGQTALPIEASPALASLPNPYLKSARQGIPAIGDLSYYRGRYYLYWGPAPAAMLLPWAVLDGQTVGDEVIVFAAVSLIFVFGALILLYLRRSYFPSLPGWLLAAGIAVVATSHPMLWSLNGPNIYAAAIASGQAFLLAGVYFALPAVDQSQTQPWRYGLIGALWALALGSRLTLSGGVMVLAVGVVVATLFPASRGRSWRSRIASSAALLSPLILGIGLLGFYNYMRFGDVLESGFRYQFTGYDLGHQLAQGRIFNPAYLLPNLLYHLAAPIRFVSVFPFIRPVYNAYPLYSAFLARFRIPSEYGLESNVGLLFAMPVVLCAGVLAIGLPWREALMDGGRAGMADGQESRVKERHLTRIVGLLILGGLASLAPVLVFTYTTARYLLDAVPILAVLSAVGAWRIYESSHPFPVRGLLARVILITVGVLTVLVSFLMALNGAGSSFDEINPEVYEFLMGLFS